MLLREGLLLIAAIEEWMMRKTTKIPYEKDVKDLSGISTGDLRDGKFRGA
jgi:hypothetical protein